MSAVCSAQKHFQTHLIYYILPKGNNFHTNSASLLTVRQSHSLFFSFFFFSFHFSLLPCKVEIGVQQTTSHILKLLSKPGLDFVICFLKKIHIPIPMGTGIYCCLILLFFPGCFPIEVFLITFRRKECLL